MLRMWLFSQEHVSMKCVQLMESWCDRSIVSFLSSQCQLNLDTFSMKFSVINCEGEMETKVPDIERGYYPPTSDMQWCDLPAVIPKLSPTHSPAWGHLKMELDLQAMMEEDTTPKCHRDLYLAFTHSDKDTDGRQECSEPVRVDIIPCDADSFYDETEETSSLPKCEDRNLARLIAKFDSSIEALWNPEDSTDMAEDYRDDDVEDHLIVSPIPMDVHGSKQNLFIACGTNITSSIWSSRTSPEEPLRDEWSLPVNVKWSEGETNPCFDSLLALNHNREDSSFTEVIPRSLQAFREAPPPMPVPPQATVLSDPGKEEEDLLTSARTHFIPIRQDHSTHVQHHTTSYADGTTFAIQTSMDHITFTRSESGALYLKDDAGLASPRKFMEFKGKDFCDKSFDVASCNSKALADFVPKFRVSQNEKYCQTEQDDTFNESAGWSGQKGPCTTEDFYFPGDEHLSLEEEEEEVCFALDGKRNKICSGPAWISGWSTDAQAAQPSPQSWYRIWKDGGGTYTGVTGCWDCNRPAESHKNQLKRELTEDGEQLLSDLSSLLDQYGGVLSEINGNKRDHTEKLSEYTINFKVKKTGPLCGQVDSDWIICERPINLGMVQKERKRRYSSSQRACSLFLEGSCRRPHCRFSHDMASIPCRFWADASCLKGGKCPFLHGGHRGGRPVTL